MSLDGLWAHLAPFYSPIRRPSTDPELLTRMLLRGYVFGVRSEPRLSEEVRLSLAYRWFCRWAGTATRPTTRPSRRTLQRPRRVPSRRRSPEAPSASCALPPPLGQKAAFFSKIRHEGC